MDVFEFKDAKVTADPVHKYPASLRDSQIPLIIDNGSYQCRVGWMNSENPILKFKSVIAKPRKERSKKDKDSEPTQTPQIQVGNDITNLEAVRFQLKTQFDRNIVTHYEAQEHIFDYIFTHLGINNEGSVPHPIVMTEAFLNPNYSRQLMSELLFECYAVPSVCYGVDALFGINFGQNKNNQLAQNTLIISLGYYSIHIIPILGGKVIFQHARRINIGGYHIVTFLHKLLQLKYPAHSAQITLGRVEELLHDHCEIALDYQQELNRWANSDYYEENIRRIQLPFAAVVPISGLTLEQQKERKKELAQRLISLNARKREERLAEDEDKLNNLLLIQEHFDEGEDELFTRGLEENSLKSLEELQKNITALNTRIEKTKLKILQANSNEEKPEEIVEETKIKTGKFEPGPNEDLQTWLIGVKRKRQDLLTKRHARKQRRSDLAKRRTAAAQERMRLISQLARKEKGNDDFGMRDEDWDIYKTISRDAGDSDSEVENEKLVELEEILKQHEPTVQGGAVAEGGEQEGVGEAYQLHLGVERFRAPEVVFQPSMVGLIEAGLAETIGYILKQFPDHIQQQLVDNIVLLGGASQIKGLRERLNRELREIRPFQSMLSIKMADNPELCPWVGARNFAKTPALKKCLISRAEYLEYGGEYLKSYSCGNVYFPTPKTTVQGETIDI